jgi:hypothetical protein
MKFKFSALKLIALGVLAGAIMLGSCTNDQLPEPTPVEGCQDSIPTYEGSVKAIIDNSCAYAGCHFDNSAPGIYSSYNGLLGILENNLFRSRVIINKDDPQNGMPPDYAPDGRPKDLTPEELDIITCWLDNGFPER